MSFKLTVVIPIYNEASNIRPLYQALLDARLDCGEYEFLFVDDGSTDESLNILKQLRQNDQHVKFISFTRNFGHQFAIKAGIDHAAGDCIVTMDADLQHPPPVINEFIKEWKNGNLVVYSKRSTSKGSGLIKGFLSSLFYKILSVLSAVPITPDSADFRLIDRKVADVIRPNTDNFLFLRGLLPWLGFRSETIIFSQADRHSGSTKYSFKKMMTLAVNGITSFSIKPLRISILFGMITSGLAFLYGIYVLYIKLFTTDAIQGWASVLIAILFIGGLQLIMIGVVGEYIGKLFIQSKGRQPYIVKEQAL